MTVSWMAILAIMLDLTKVRTTESDWVPGKVGMMDSC